MSASSPAIRAWAEREMERAVTLRATAPQEVPHRELDMRTARTVPQKQQKTMDVPPRHVRQEEAKAEQPKVLVPSPEERRRETQEKGMKAGGWQAAPHAEIEQLLIAAACQNQTFTADELELLRSDHRMDLSTLLVRIDRAATDSTPLLSSLVTDGDGAPLPYFRDILRAAGYKAPQPGKALELAWRREQERAYAAYADPPQPLPERLVLRVGATGQSMR